MAKRDLRAERQRQRIEDNQQSILRAAEHVFAKNGYAQASMDEIAGEAQFSKATLYRYYRSKAEIFRAVMIASLQEALRAFQRIEKKELSAESRLWEIIHYILMFYKQKESFARIFLMERNALKKALNLDIHDHMIPSAHKQGLPEEFGHNIQSFRDCMRLVIQDGMDAGEFRPMDPSEAAYILGALLRGFHFHGLFQDKIMTVDESTELLHGFFMHGLRASK
jgi:AcrR family transcriptional regulator